MAWGELPQRTQLKPSRQRSRRVPGLRCVAVTSSPSKRPFPLHLYEVTRHDVTDFYGELCTSAASCTRIPIYFTYSQFLCGCSFLCARKARSLCALRFPPRLCPSPRPVLDDFLAFQLPFLDYSLQILCANKSELRSRWMSFPPSLSFSFSSAPLSMTFFLLVCPALLPTA